MTRPLLEPSIYHTRGNQHRLYQFNSMYIYITVWFGFIMFNAILNNISVILWRSVLLVEETVMLYTSPWVGVKPTTSVVIGTDCIGSCKFNYHTITATTAPKKLVVVVYTRVNIVENSVKHHKIKPNRSCLELHYLSNVNFIMKYVNCIHHNVFSWFEIGITYSVISIIVR